MRRLAMRNPAGWHDHGSAGGVATTTACARTVWDAAAHRGPRAPGPARLETGARRGGKGGQPPCTGAIPCGGCGVPWTPSKDGRRHGGVSDRAGVGHRIRAASTACPAASSAGVRRAASFVLATETIQGGARGGTGGLRAPARQRRRAAPACRWRHRVREPLSRGRDCSGGSCGATRGGGRLRLVPPWAVLLQWHDHWRMPRRGPGA